jgi:hypothetical protein
MFQADISANIDAINEQTPSLIKINKAETQFIQPFKGDIQGRSPPLVG